MQDHDSEPALDRRTLSAGRGAISVIAAVTSSASGGGGASARSLRKKTDLFYKSRYAS